MEQRKLERIDDLQGAEEVSEGFRVHSAIVLWARVSGVSEHQPVG